MLTETLPVIEELNAYDSSRLCPMLAGPAMIDGDRLIVRLADGDISINASRALLRKIFSLCDGTRSIDELLQTVRHEAERDRLGRFMHFLLESDALIDACYFSLGTTSYAWGNNPFGQAADPKLSTRIGRRFSSTQNAQSSKNIHQVGDTPLDQQFAGRTSTYTFGDAPLALDDLNVLLWSMAGIVDAQRQREDAIVPRRTLPSAGAMHLTEIYVALQRQAIAKDGRLLTPGIYRIRYPGEKMVQYEAVGTDISLLPRTLAKPWLLSSASGIVFIAANAQLAALRYRNRSVQYLFMEAGMVLQNGALTAADLGLGFVTFGSYYEAAVRQMCGLSEHLVLGSAIFGAMPTPYQVAQNEHCLEVEFAWADAPSEQFTLPYFVGRAKLKDGTTDHPTWGRDTDPALACRKALAESIERKGYREPRKLRQAAFAELENALDPRLIARFSDTQYRKQGFRYQPYSENAIHLWATGEEYGTGKEVSILADLVYSTDSLLREYGRTSFYWCSNSSGCAAGTTVAAARQAALLELIERDAFMRHWFKQVPGTGIDCASLPDSIRHRVQALAGTGFTVSVQTLPSPWAQVAFFFAKHPQRRFSCVSAGARLTLEAALDSALVELESRAFSLLHGHHVGDLKPADVNSPDDHFALYSKTAYFERADRLFSPDTQIRFDAACSKDLPNRDTLFDRMIATGITPVFVDITPRLNGINGGRERLAVTRAFAPSLLPMSFGAGLEPRGMVKDIHPASLFPHPFP